MPALPLQGATREAQEEEEDEEDEEDGDDEEETENGHENHDTDEENVDLSQSRSSFSSERSYASGIGIDMQRPSSSSSTEPPISIYHPEKEGQKNTNANYTAEDDSDEASNSSVYETAPSASSSAMHSRQNSLLSKSTKPPVQTTTDDHHLPPIDFGPTPDLGKLDLSFLNQPPMSSLSKGKARMSLTEDAGRTPTAAKSRRLKQDQADVLRGHPEGEVEDYFRIEHHPRPHSHPHPHPYYRSMSDQTVRGGPRNISPSPSRTPRPGDRHAYSPSSNPFGGSSRQLHSASPGLPSFGMTLAGGPLSRSSSVISRDSNRTAVGAPYRNVELKANLGLSRASSLSQHPGMYKRASKSLIDVHALEKREEVERIVWEEEEKAERKMVKNRQSKGDIEDGEFFFFFLSRKGLGWF